MDIQESLMQKEGKMQGPKLRTNQAVRLDQSEGGEKGGEMRLERDVKARKVFG